MRRTKLARGRERRRRERRGHDYSPVRRDLVAVVARAAGGLFVAVARPGEEGGEKTRVRVSSIMMSSLSRLCLKARPITWLVGRWSDKARPKSVLRERVIMKMLRCPFQSEIVKRLSAIVGQVLPFLSQEHQQQVATAVERAKQVTMSELNSVIGVSQY